MRFSNHVRSDVAKKISSMVSDMADWESEPLVNDDDRKRIRDGITFFGHCAEPRGFRIAGVDGSGDFPALTYSDSFVYVAVADCAKYEVVAGPSLSEVESPEPVIEFIWMPESADRLRIAWDSAFESLSGLSVRDVVEQSDYKHIDGQLSGRPKSVGEYVEELVRPHASDKGNIAIQLRTCAELGAANRLISSDQSPRLCSR